MDKQQPDENDRKPNIKMQSFQSVMDKQQPDENDRKPNIKMQSFHPAQDFVTLWQSGASNDDAQTKLQHILATSPLCGRMVHGFPNEPSFGKLLSTDEWKRLSWVFGSDALAQFLGKSARDVCLHLGFGEDWLDGKLQLGISFKLCIFPAVSAVLATWDGVEELLREFYSDVWPKIRQHYDTIRTMDIESIQQEATYDMEQANFAGRDPATGESTHDGYMSLQRLQQIDHPSLVQVRQFLWDEVGLKKLFRGDGYTYDDRGRRGNREYLAAQRPLAEIPGIAIVDVVPR